MANFTPFKHQHVPACPAYIVHTNSNKVFTHTDLKGWDTGHEGWAIDLKLYNDILQYFCSNNISDNTTTIVQFNNNYFSIESLMPRKPDIKNNKTKHWEMLN